MLSRAGYEPIVAEDMKAAMKELELPEKSDEECRTTIGLRLEEIPAVLWPEIPELSEKYATTYRRIFDELKRPLNVECFPDVVESRRSPDFVTFLKGRKSIPEYQIFSYIVR